MRITQQMVNMQFLQGYQKNMQLTSKYQQQVSSGKKIGKPSDDPSGTVQGLKYQSSLADIEQYQKNAQDGIGWVQATDTALGDVTSILQRVRELMVQGSNDTNNATDRQSIATEIRSLQGQLGDSANAMLGDRYLFSGGNTAPYQNGSLQTNNQENVQWRIGNGVSVTPGITASSVFDYQVGGKNILQTLDSIAQTLENGSSPSGLIANVDKQLDNISTQRAIIGSKQNVLEAASNQLDQTNTLTQKMLSDTTDVDIAQAYTNLTTQETVLKSALSAGARIVQPTLVDFLR